MEETIEKFYDSEWFSYGRKKEGRTKAKVESGIREKRFREKGRSAPR